MGYLQLLYQEPPQLYDTAGYRCDSHKPMFAHTGGDMTLALQRSRANCTSHGPQGRLLELAPLHIIKLYCLKCSVHCYSNWFLVKGQFTIAIKSKNMDPLNFAYPKC